MKFRSRIRSPELSSTLRFEKTEPSDYLKEATTGSFRSLLLDFFSIFLLSNVDITRNLIINYVICLVFLRLYIDAQLLNLSRISLKIILEVIK